MRGWIILMRAIMEHWIWEDDKLLKRFLTILMLVNHKPAPFPVGNELHTCEAGQSFRSIENWSSQFNCSKKTTIKFFDMLEKDGMIKTEVIGSGNRRKHLLTVANWSKYQNVETENYTKIKPETTPKQNPNIPSNNNNNNENNENKIKEPEKQAPSSPKNENINWKIFLDTYAQYCSSLIQIKKNNGDYSFSEDRKKTVRLRVKEYGKASVFEMMKKAGQSDFLSGKNDRGWKADFDWIFKPKNFRKILEGGHDNRKKPAVKPESRYVPAPHGDPFEGQPVPNYEKSKEFARKAAELAKKKRLN